MTGAGDTPSKKIYGGEAPPFPVPLPAPGIDNKDKQVKRLEMFIKNYSEYNVWMLQGNLRSSRDHCDYTCG